MDAGYSQIRQALRFVPGLQIGTYSWQAEDNQLFWSDEQVKLYGLDRAPISRAEFVELIHPEDRIRVEGYATDLLAPKASSYSHTFRVIRPDGSIRVILDRGTIERDSEGNVTVMRGVNVDVTDEAHLNYSAEVALQASEDRYRQLFNVIDEAFAIFEVKLDGPDGRIDYRVVEANPAFSQHSGFPTQTLMGKWLREALPQLEEQWFETYGGVARTRQPLRFEQGSEIVGRWWDVYAFPVDDPNQNRIGVLFTDITERKRREAEAQVIVDEINHRSKNMLAVVQAIARQTANAGNDDFLASFSNRVQALAASNDLLSRNEWKTASLADLIQSQLSPFFDLQSPRIRFGGPEVALNVVATKALGMALHELATNAAKYGAMSTDEGRIEVSWDITAAAEFVLTWQERGGPPIPKPSRKGFGTKVTGWMTEANTGGKVVANFSPEGLVWRLACPAAQVLP